MSNNQQITEINRIIHENNLDLSGTLEQAIKQLDTFLTDPNFEGPINLASEGNWEPQAARELIGDIVNGRQLPTIEIVSTSQLRANGGFGNNTIYLSEELFSSDENSQIATEVLLEELGHYLDSQLSTNDSPGDEGAIFASLVQNRTFDSAELLELKTRDDRGTINLNGQTIAIEQSNPNNSADSFPTSRDPWLWPFDAQSIWNMPIGSDAQYSPANLERGEMTSVDREIFIQTTEDDPLTRVYAPGSWRNRATGTNSPTGNPKDEIYIHFPTDKIVPDASGGHTPNNVATILQPDGETIVSLGPLARTEVGGPVYGWYFGEDNIYDGMGIKGGHGGSKLSGIGGSIRVGELTGDDPIRHALKINLWAEKYLYYDSSDSTPGYRWPALVADSYAADRYGGSNPQLEMGSLLALSPDATPESIGISSVPGLKLFYALQDYGAYVVDDSAWDVTAFNLQEEAEIEFEETYGYKFETRDHNSQWYNEYYSLVENLQIVTNSSESAIGGGGERRVPLAPPFNNQIPDITETPEVPDIPEVVENPEPETPSDKNGVIGEVGAYRGITHDIQTIQLSNDYVNPVVFALPLSHNGGDVAIPRITEITNNSFSVYVQEPEYMDGLHQRENFSYMVVEAGNWQLADGTVIQVGTVDTDANATLGAWSTVSFNNAFSETPVVLSQVQTNNDDTFVRTRQQLTNNQGFQLALEKEEALSNFNHGKETVGWLAIEQGVGTSDGLQFQAGITGEEMNHRWNTIEFEADFETAPNLLASLGSYNDGDPAGLRYRDLNSDGVAIRVQEDHSADLETGHDKEIVNFLAIEGTGELIATAYNASDVII
ncbi:MAG: hypothetical protein ACFCU5_06280 [Pleurocapsa sp.]